MNIKKSIISCLALIACMCASAQQNYGSPIIANEDFNIVYSGYENRLAIAVPGVANDDIVVTSDSATITKDGDRWLCKVNCRCNELTINVSVRNGDQIQPVGSQVFRVLLLPNPVAYVQLANGELWDSDHGGIRKSQFEGAKVVASYGPESMIKANFQIKSFKLIIPDGNGGYWKIDSDGDRFSKEQLAEIWKLRSGSQVSLSNIEYTGVKSGHNLPFAPLVLK